MQHDTRGNSVERGVESVLYDLGVYSKNGLLKEFTFGLSSPGNHIPPVFTCSHHKPMY